MMAWGTLTVLSTAQVTVDLPVAGAPWMTIVEGVGKDG